jgi:hypothetical protein
MKNRMRRRARGLFFSILCAALTTVPFAAATADSHEDAGFTLPDWVSLVSPGGKYVHRSGSKGKFREDYNLQSGADNHLHIDHTDGGESYRLRGFGQSGEKQGYLIGEYGQLGSFDVLFDLQAWTEYYNQRTDGDRPSAFPGSNSSRLFFGDNPSTDWFTVGGGASVRTDSFFSDVYLDFHYRDVNGDMTPLKAGTVDGLVVGGSGPGSVDFDYPGRKKVDYDSYMSFVGGHSGVGGINWQTDLTYQYHDLQSKLTEPNFDASSPGGIDEVGRFDEDSEVHVVKYDIAGGRALASNVYVFGSGFFSYERSDPEPDQFIATGSSVLQTRSTSSSGINRYTPAASFGTVYQAASNLVISADTSVRGHIANADLDEERAESTFFPPGDQGTLSNDVDRYAVVSTTRVDADWKVAPRVKIRANARYQYRWDDVDSRQDNNFVAAEPAEIEKYQTDSHRLKVGTSVRYSMRKGRSVEAGYQYGYTDVEQDVDELQNQFILGDYDSQRHRAYLKAGGRIVKKLRGELRGQYVYETRDMDAPSVNTGIFVTDSGKSKTEHWNVTPALYYMPHDDWSLYGNYSIGLLRIEAAGGNAFKYRTLTQSASAGVTYRATEEWSASVSYTGYLNDDSVENIGHNASVTAGYEISENWEIHGGYRYLGYNLDGSSLNDYDASVVTLGLTGRF